MAAWSAGGQAGARARDDAGPDYEVVVDISGRRIASIEERAGEPPITYSEIEATKIVLSNAAFQEGLKKRGVTDMTKVFCGPFSAGYYGDPAQDGKRLVKVGCFDTRKSTTNMFGWPIERLYALVDLRKGEVLSVTDYGVVPIAEGDFNYTEAAVGTLRDARKPTMLAQPEGSNFTSTATKCPGATGGSTLASTRASARSISLARWRDASGGGRSSIRAISRRCSCPTWTPTTAGSRAPTSTPANTAQAFWRRL